MCNYFSIGIESRIGLGFDKKRTASVCCNKFFYFTEGLKKMFGCCCLSKTLKIKDVVSYVSTIDAQGNDKILFASSKDLATDRYLSNFFYLVIIFVVGNPISLVCTNINSMMGGRANLWESGKDRDLGLVDAVGKAIDKRKLDFNDTQAADDDLLEFTILSSVVHLGLGRANRVAQEKGPVTIVFKDFDTKPLETYF
jgi:diacylglycerol kinase (ATP)